MNINKMQIIKTLHVLIEIFSSNRSKWTMLKPVFVVAICSYTLLTEAQTFEEQLQQSRKEYNQYVEEKSNEYKSFVEEQDKEFAEYLKQNWQTFKMVHAKRQPQYPAPDKYPSYIDSVHYPLDMQQQLFSEIEMEVLVQPEIRKAKTTESFSFYKKVQTSFKFYSQPIDIEHADIAKINIPAKYDNIAISEAWEQLQKSYLHRCVDQLLDIKDSLNLNDWGYYLLVRDFTKQIHTGEQYYKLVFWYLMLKSQFDIKIGYNDSELLVLVPFNTSIYEVPYYNIENTSYYVFESGNPGTIKTYSHKHPASTRVVEPQMRESPKLGNEKLSKKITHNYHGELQPYSVYINPNLKGFYNDYPLMEIENYFNAVMPNYTAKPLINKIKRHTKNMNEVEAVDYILNFTQNVFEYKSDVDQFGKEKIYFPDEIFHYSYSDCEDRAVFFAYLVKEALNLKVIGLNYPEHVAVAVRLSSDVKGNYIVLDGDKYIICDPTYVNAPIGALIPDHLNKKAKIINIRN